MSWDVQDNVVGTSVEKNNPNETAPSESASAEAPSTDEPRWSRFAYLVYLLVGVGTGLATVLGEIGWRVLEPVATHGQLPDSLSRVFSPAREAYVFPQAGLNYTVLFAPLVAIVLGLYIGRHAAESRSGPVLSAWCNGWGLAAVTVIFVILDVGLNRGLGRPGLGFSTEAVIWMVGGCVVLGVAAGVIGGVAGLLGERLTV